MYVEKGIGPVALMLSRTIFSTFDTLAGKL